MFLIFTMFNQKNVKNFYEKYKNNLIIKNILQKLILVA